MNTEVVMQISGSVVVLCQLGKAVGVRGRWGLLLAALFSGVGAGLWAWSTDSFSQAGAWPLFSGYIVVLSAAAGVFNLVNKTAEQVTLMRGTGSGS